MVYRYGVSRIGIRRWFAPSDSAFMIDYRVGDLAGMPDQLRAQFNLAATGITDDE
jgi:hypothetical protein